MSIGIVSQDEFNLELSRLNGKSTNVEVKQIEHGRSIGDNNVPVELQKIIQEESINGTKPDELNEIFGVSKSSISAYKKGATSTTNYNNPKQELVNSRNDIKLRISSKATNKILQAMKFITEEKLQNAKVRDLASIAKDFSSVARNMEPPEVTAQQNNQYIFYVPKSRSIEDFEVIPVNK